VRFASNRPQTIKQPAVPNLKHGQFFIGQNRYLFTGGKLWQGGYLGLAVIQQQSTIVCERNWTLTKKSRGITNLRVFGHGKRKPVT